MPWRQGWNLTRTEIICWQRACRVIGIYSRGSWMTLVCICDIKPKDVKGKPVNLEFAGVDVWQIEWAFKSYAYNKDMENQEANYWYLLLASHLCFVWCVSTLAVIHLIAITGQTCRTTMRKFKISYNQAKTAPDVPRRRQVKLPRSYPARSKQ